MSGTRRTPPGVPDSFTGTPVTRTEPSVACGTESTISRAAVCGSWNTSSNERTAPHGTPASSSNAAQAARKAININPNNATALAYAAGGTVLQGDPEKYEQAQLFADDAVRIEPNNPIARYYMATVFTYQGLYTEAMEQYILGIETDPANPNLHIGLAYNYYGTGSIPDALLSFEDALAVDPDNAIAFDGRAYMYLQLGDMPLAEQMALEATRLNPEMARAQGRLGEAYFQQNNYADAIEALEAAVNLYGRATDLNARFFNMLATAYIRRDLNQCSLATPLFEQVLDATTNEFIVAGANEGLLECRRATLGSEQ